MPDKEVFPSNKLPVLLVDASYFAVAVQKGDRGQPNNNNQAHYVELQNGRRVPFHSIYQHSGKNVTNSPSRSQHCACHQ